MASDRIQRRIERLLDQIENEADQQNWQRVLDLAGDTQSLKYSIFGRDYTAIRNFHDDPLTGLIHGGRYYVVIELM